MVHNRTHSSIPGRVVARKTANQTWISNTTLSDITDLTLPVVGNATYEFEAWIMYDGVPAADIKISVSGPVGASSPMWAGLGVPSNATATIFSFNSAAVTTIASGGYGFGTVGVGSRQLAIVYGVLHTAATAGMFALKAAQIVADATPTTVFADSKLRLTRET